MAASGVNQTQGPEEEEIMNCIAIFMTREKITALAKNLKAKVHSADGRILLACDSGPFKAIKFNEGSIFMIPSKKKKKDDLVELATKLSVCNARTVAEIKSRLKRYSEAVNNQYLAHDV